MIDISNKITINATDIDISNNITLNGTDIEIYFVTRSGFLLSNW